MASKTLIIPNIFLINVITILNFSNFISATNNPCITPSALSNCNSCIKAHPSCQWCEYQSLSSNVSRCETADFWEDSGHCVNSGGYSNLISPESKWVLNRDDDFGRISSKNQNSESTDNNNKNNENHIIQMRPQHISAGLRRGETKAFNITFKLAEDYPVDLYYLMDLSQSMFDDLQSLRALGKNIAEELRSLTSSLQMGFGSFVDKPVMPFINTLPERLENPCITSGNPTGKNGCETPYLFKNTFSLSDNIDEFIAAVQKADHSSNLDAPEGGLEAMMQAIVCSKEIGWRTGEKEGEKAATKLLVYSSDAGFHTAGDGKLAGIILPNDMKCHGLGFLGVRFCF